MFEKVNLLVFNDVVALMAVVYSLFVTSAFSHFPLSFFIVLSFLFLNHEFLHLRKASVSFVLLDIIYLVLVISIFFTRFDLTLFSICIILATFMFLLLFNFACRMNLLERQTLMEKDFINQFILVLLVISILVGILTNLVSSKSIIFYIAFIMLVFLSDSIKKVVEENK